MVSDYLLIVFVHFIAPNDVGNILSPADKKHDFQHMIYHQFENILNPIQMNISLYLKASGMMTNVFSKPKKFIRLNEIDAISQQGWRSRTTRGGIQGITFYAGHGKNNAK